MNNKDNKSLGYKAGQIIGAIITACFVSVVCALLLAVSVKVIVALYGWVF